MWGAIRRLREIGLCVRVIVADGTTSNRNFFKLHKHEDGIKEGVTFKVRDIF